MPKKWKTKIADSGTDRTVVRGYNLMDLIGKLSFSEMIFLEWTGKLPTENERKMLDAMLVSTVEHGIAPPSITAARIAFSGGNPISAGVAAGVLAIGEHHGGAIEQAAKVYQENLLKPADQVVNEYRKERKRLPGYGHKIYTTDPRTVKMFEVAKSLGMFGHHCRFAQEIERSLEKSLGRKYCLNVDGAIAALLSDMGLDWRLGKGFFIAGRTIGIIAHLHEEWTTEPPFRRLDKDEYEYLGEDNKKV